MNGSKSRVAVLGGGLGGLEAPFYPRMKPQNPPGDDRGIFSSDLEPHQVAEHPTIYAVWYAADFPVGQAFPAFRQARPLRRTSDAVTRSTRACPRACTKKEWRRGSRP